MSLPQRRLDNLKPDLISKVRSYYTRAYRDWVGLPDWEVRVAKRIEEEKLYFKDTIGRIETLIGDLSGKLILNVGCGTGGFNIIAHGARAKVWGVEPNPEAIAICKEKAKMYGIVTHTFIRGEAEYLPFDDRTFDVVICTDVLEHVSDIDRSIHEMVRVIHPDGKFYIWTPDFRYWFEHHYKLIWPPFCPKFLAKYYFALRGRPSEYISTLNYITPSRLKRAFMKEPVKLEIINRGTPFPLNPLFWPLYFYGKLFQVLPAIEAVGCRFDNIPLK